MINPTPLTEAFGERLLVARFNYHHVSQETIAERAEVHRTQITLMERGLREPTLGTLIRVAGAVDLTVGGLLGPIRWVPGTPGCFDLGEKAR
ncbi:MAG TPA: helix-turn-helix transcriptional regulator [Solirubrobacterales bacterium]|nr:helix-turn-helix transcriptional regulator [Solirubrobacterales bacterium]